MKRKTIKILFSGGLDSTYLVWKALNEGHRVQPVYVELVNNKTKVEAEKKTISELMKLFREDFQYQIEDVQFNVKFETRSIGILDFVQPPIWITSSLFYSSNADEMWIGYVLNDDAISFLPEIKKLYYSFRPFVHKNNMPKLVFPITKVSKSEIQDKLPKKYSVLTYSCENPDKIDDEYSECGHCDPCSRKIRTFGESSLKKAISKNPEIKEKLKAVFTSTDVMESAPIESFEAQIEIKKESESHECES